MRAGLVATMLALGCPVPTQPDPDPPPTTDDTAAPAPKACGDATTTFTSSAPLPADASLVALVQRDEGDLAPSLAHLAKHVEGGASGLSVPTGFALSQWTWELPLVLAVLDGVHVETKTIASVQASSLRVWVVPLGCAFDELLASLERDFDVDDTGGAAIVAPRDRTRFAYDIVVRPDAIALCPPGAARKVLAAWDRSPAVGAPPSLRDAVFAMDGATIRIGVRETGLLGRDAPDSRTGDHLLRIDGAGVNATLAP